MAFCIMRLKKQHGNSNVCSSLAHLFRTVETKNADPEKMYQNFFYPNFYEDGDKSLKNDLEYRKKMRRQAIAMYKKRLATVGKVRKNAVRAVEMVMTFSPEALKNPEFNPTEYLHDCKNWVMKKFGKENVFAFAYHRDETTPHVSILFTPIVDGKLNAREYFGGAKKMKGLQDEFYQAVGLKHKLQRGIPKAKTKAEHKSIREYYQDVNKAEWNAERAKLVDEPCKLMGLDGKIISCSEGLFKGVQRSVARSKEYFEKYNETVRDYNELLEDYKNLKNNPKALRQRLQELESREHYHGR